MEKSSDQEKENGDGDASLRVPLFEKTQSSNCDNDEWMHALGSFSVMITPVTITMLLASWTVLHIQSPASLQQPIEYVYILLFLSLNSYVVNTWFTNLLRARVPLQSLRKL